MSSESAVNPNDPCPCGSGKKYKRCCESAEGPATPKWKRATVGGLIVLGMCVLVFGPMFRDESASSSSSGVGFVPRSAPISVPPAAQTPATRPPGPAPPGKVWSVEHGHWHDAQRLLTGPGATPLTQTGVLTPQPPGPVPPGKVWSAEHGHWHDLQPPAQSFTPAPQPDGPVPPGKVWSLEHGHWHDAPTAQSAPSAADPAPVTIDFSPKTP